MKAGVKETESTRFSPFSNIREGWIVSILLGLAFGVRLYQVFHTYLIWEFSGQMVSVVFGSVTIIPLYFLIRSLLGRTMAVISSLLFVFYPYIVRFSAEVIRGPTFLFFLVMALWVGWEAISRKRAWLFFLTSLLGAVSFLEVPEDQDLLEYAKRNRVNFLAINEKDIDQPHANLVNSIDSDHFKEEVVIGEHSGSCVIRIYSVES